jgi:hypothetical protein
MLALSAGNNFSLAEEIIAVNKKSELLLTPKEIEKKLNGRARLLRIRLSYFVSH